MFILENVPLVAYSTMKLGGNAAYLVEINSRSEVSEAVEWAEARHLPVKMIGSGSNLFWSDNGFSGLVIVNKILGFEVLDQENDFVFIAIGAGENWDEIVARTTTMNLTGIEQLSLIPGSTGATPVQNVGAYGREIADVLTTIEAYDRHEKKLVTIPVADCGFSYRMSRFKSNDKDRFLITSITLQLLKGNPVPPFYDSLQRYLTEHHVATYTPTIIRNAVIAIRSSKLPDPTIVANNGSFFYNPIISKNEFAVLKQNYPEVAHWPYGENQVKVSAAWLLEQSGFKDYHDAETGMATWASQPLVIVNESATSTASLLAFKQKIVDAVYSKFKITLEQEPELIS